MSNVIKSTHYNNQVEKKVIEPRFFIPPIIESQATIDSDIDESVNEQFLLARQQAKELIDTANHEISALKANAEQEIAAWRSAEQKLIEEQREQIFQSAKEQGYEDGYQIGYRTGVEEGIRQYQSQIEHAASLVEQIEADWKRRIALSEPYLVELTIEIAKKVIQRELTTDNNTILEMVKETLRQSSELKEITLSVHPNDYNLIRLHMDDLKTLISSQANLIVLPDHSITVGGCIVRSSLGTLDARVDTQLEEIKKALLDVIEGSDADELEPIDEV